MVPEGGARALFLILDGKAEPFKRVALAVGEGSMAIAFVHQYLSQEG